MSRDTTLYRKYRPQVFEDIVGQEVVTTTIKNAYLNNNLPHAFLFSGPRGCGKTTTAKILAKLVNCMEPENGEPCNKCKNCLSTDNGSNPDIVEMDAASNRGIENMRELTSKVDLQPSFGNKRVYIIDEVHMLTQESFNALLKTLEEPPDTIMFILATTEINKVIPTIVSRCQQHNFRLISVVDISKALTRIAGEENIPIEDSGAETIALNSGGSLRDALGKLQQIKDYAGGNPITAEIVSDYLGTINSNVLFNLFELIQGKDVNKILAFINEISNDGTDPKQLLVDYEEFLRKVWLISLGEDNAELFYASQDELKKYIEVAKNLKPEQILVYIELLEDALMKFHTNAVPRIILESTFTKMAYPEMDNGTIGLKAKISKMDKNLQKMNALVEFLKNS